MKFSLTLNGSGKLNFNAKERCRKTRISLLHLRKLSSNFSLLEGNWIFSTTLEKIVKFFTQVSSMNS